MNTPKYNIEQEIKNQIDEREITPSRDLWAEIETQTANTGTSKPKLNWLLIAACLTMVFGLGFLLVNNTQLEVPQIQVAEKTIQPEFSQPQQNIKTETSPLLTEKTEPVTIDKQIVTSPQQVKIFNPEIVASKVEIPFIKEKQQISLIENTLNQSSTHIAKMDSAKIPTKRKKYVDASTLLFSVEHKDVIENSKGGSNVATIDLNTK